MSKTRLEELTERLKAQGVVDVKLTWNEAALATMARSEVSASVADFIESYLEGRGKALPAAQPAGAQTGQELTEADIKRIHDGNAFLPDLAGLVDLWPGILAFARGVVAANRARPRAVSPR